MNEIWFWYCVAIVALGAGNSILEVIKRGFGIPPKPSKPSPHAVNFAVNLLALVYCFGVLQALYIVWSMTH